MNSFISSIARHLIAMGVCSATVMAADIDSTGNSVFDLYFFGNDEAGMFGRSTGVEWMDS